MPCNSDYLAANGIEKEMSKVACLLDELVGKPIDEGYWKGYHPDVYNSHLSKEEQDEMVKELCYKLQKVNVSDYSLEMQIWWRDHKKADKQRIEAELKSIKQEKERQAALEKLTDYERNILGL
jgi:hypothetical protein